MSDPRPIGIFDSGLGGLTVAKEIYKLLPHESTVYIGDTARVPYGNRSPETITQFSHQIVDELLTHNVKAIVVACATASSVALKPIQLKHPNLPIIGVIEPAAQEAVKLSRNGQISVIGTKATINSKSFEMAINNIVPKIIVTPKSCPLFVPIIEEGITDQNPILSDTIEYYLKDISDTSIDTLILGCTHYPLIAKQIQAFLPKVKLVNPGETVAAVLRQILNQNGLLNHDLAKSIHEYFITDNNPSFATTASTFLNQTIAAAKINLG